MDTLATGFQNNTALDPEDLLVGDEVVVIVDDDPLIREPIRLFFEEYGLRVLEADSGSRFHELLDAENVALALLDIGLPDTDGQDILPHIRERPLDGETISQSQQTNAKQGTSTSLKQNVSSGNVRWKTYRTRIVSTANKANLKFDEARPALVEGLTRSIDGIF